LFYKFLRRVLSNLNHSKKRMKEPIDFPKAYIAALTRYAGNEHFCIDYPDNGAIMSRFLLLRRGDIHITRFLSSCPHYYTRGRMTTVGNIPEKVFDSASSWFAYHKGHLFDDIEGNVRPGGHVVLAGYNLKGKNLEDFLGLFNTDSQKRELYRLGANLAHKQYTRTGLIDCVQSGWRKGYLNVEASTLDEKYFIWVGRKK